MRPLTTLMFCLLSGLMAGQISDWRFTHLTTEDGLPPAIVTDMAQDRLGRMWISTFAGLVCYDGYTCRTFSHNPSDSTSLPGNRIPSITVLQGDSLLACGPGGLVLVNARNETFGQLSARTFDGVDLPQLVYDAYVDAEGLIWMTSDSGVYVLDLTAGTTELFVPISEPADIRERRFNRTIYVRPDVSDHNVLWFSNFTSIVAFDKRTRRFSLYPGPQYTEEWPLEMDQIIDFTTDPDGFVWAARAGRGLTRLDPQTGTWTQYMFNALDDILSFDRNENHLLEIRHLDEHHLLLATRYSGLVLFDKILEQFQRIVHEPGDAKSLMPGRQIALHHDREGRWWIGGEFGISIYDPALNLFQTHPTGFGQWPFFSVLRYDTSRQTLLGCKPTGMYWLGADQDTVLKASGVDQSGDLVKLAGVTDFEILHNGNIWFVTSEEIRSGVSGLFHLDLNAGTGVLLRTSGVDFPLRNLRTILQDSRRRLWIGSDRDGSVMMTPDTLVLFIDPDLKTTDTWYMAEDPQQRVWLTCYEGVRIFEEVNDVLRMRQPELPPGILSAIHQAQGLAIDDQGVVWIGTRYNGLFRIPIADIWQSSQIIEMHGLQLHNIRAVAVQDSIVWLGMNGGLGRLDPRRNNFQLFTDAHGLKHSEIHGLHVGADRRLYIGTRTGVSFAHIDTLARRLSKVPPRIYFKDFSVNGVRESELITGDLQDGFTLEYPLNSFMVTYAAVGFTEPERQQYAYQLEGADDQFNLAGSRQFTSYNNLDPGRYLLRVKAANSMGYWNEEGAVLPIYVKPAFWQTLGFRIGLGLLLAGLLYGGYRYRIAQVRRESRLVMEFNQKLASAESQALRAQMNPHFIFNALNSIKLYMMDRDPREASGYLDDFARLVRLVLQNSKETLISLEKELEALDLYIRMEKLRFEKEFAHQIEIDPDLDASFFEVPPLLLQPYVENAIWHGFMSLERPGNLNVRARLVDDHLQIDIIDNGVGRVRAAELKQARPAYKKSLGMQITAERMELHKTLSGKEITVQVKDLVDAEGKAAGTHVQIEVAA